MTTPSALIGIESKRFEPFRGKKPASFSDAYWGPVWGDDMNGYEGARDHASTQTDICTSFSTRHNSSSTPSPCGQRSINRRSGHDALTPILFYVYAEPDIWPKDGRPVDEGDKAKHREEIAHFRQGRGGRRSSLCFLFLSRVAGGLGAPQGRQDSRPCSRRDPTFFAVIVTCRQWRASGQVVAFDLLKREGKVSPAIVPSAHTDSLVYTDTFHAYQALALSDFLTSWGDFN